MSAKVSRLVTLIVDWPEEPGRMVSLAGMAEMLKSGDAGLVTLTLTLAECEMEPLVPVTITV